MASPIIRTACALALAISAGLCLAIVISPSLPITVINEKNPEGSNHAFLR